MTRLCPHQVIMLGPPGAGKGTQAGRFADCLGVVHLSPGAILRWEIPVDSVIGQRIRALMAAGELVPEELVDGVVRDRLEALRPEQGFVVDGYPRTAAEAHSLRDLLATLGRLEPRPVVVWLEVPREELSGACAAGESSTVARMMRRTPSPIGWLSTMPMRGRSAALSAAGATWWRSMAARTSTR